MGALRGGPHPPSGRTLAEAALCTLAVLIGGRGSLPAASSLLATTTRVCCYLLLRTVERILSQDRILTSSNNHERLAELELNLHIHTVLILTITGQ